MEGLWINHAGRGCVEMEHGKLHSLAASTAETLISTSDGPLVRLLTRRARAPNLDYELLYGFLLAAFRWEVMDEEYCRQYCLPDRSTENERRTAAAADAKRAARNFLEAEFRRFGINGWTHVEAVDARQRVRQILKHSRSSKRDFDQSLSTAANWRKRLGSASTPTRKQTPASTPTRTPSRAAHRQQTTPIRSTLPREDVLEESEAQLLRHQVRQLERRMQQLEQDNTRLSEQVDRLSLQEDSARALAGHTVTITQLVQDAVSAALQGKATSAAACDSDSVTRKTTRAIDDWSQRREQQYERSADGCENPGSSSTMSANERLHWAATRIQAVHRGRINRSIGDE